MSRLPDLILHSSLQHNEQRKFTNASALLSLTMSKLEMIHVMSALLCGPVGGFAAAPVTISSMTLYHIFGDSSFSFVTRKGTVKWRSSSEFTSWKFSSTRPTYVMVVPLAARSSIFSSNKFSMGCTFSSGKVCPSYSLQMMETWTPCPIIQITVYHSSLAH